MKSLEDRKRDILEEVKRSGNYEFHSTYTIDQALTQLNAIDKPRIDGGKLVTLLKATLDNEAKRNNGSKAIHIHPYNEICSCGRCHLSGLLAREIVKRKEGWLR